MKTLCLIPARGGSKSIPRKNIKPFGDHPLIAYSIAAAKQSQMAERIIVSTEDEEIAAISRQYGAEVPFIRPRELAEDNTLDWPVFLNALQWLKSHDTWYPDIVVHLRPTQPLRPKSSIDEGVRLLMDNPEADSVRSIVHSGQNPYKMWKMKGKFLAPLLRHGKGEFFNMPRQSLPLTYWHSGQVDVIWSATISDKHSMSGDKILPFLFDARFGLDLDTKEEWEYGEWLLHRVKDIIAWPSLP